MVDTDARSGLPLVPVLVPSLPVETDEVPDAVGGRSRLVGVVFLIILGGLLTP